MPKHKLNFALLSILLSNLFFIHHAIAASDKGHISVYFASGSGNVAIQLDHSFPNAIAAGECPTADGSAYAGVSAAVDPILKSTILAAKASDSEVTIITEGCEVGGGWYKLKDMYIH